MSEQYLFQPSLFRDRGSTDVKHSGFSHLGAILEYEYLQVPFSLGTWQEGQQYFFQILPFFGLVYLEVVLLQDSLAQIGGFS